MSNLTGISVGNDWDKEIDESVFQNTDYDTIMLKVYWKTINTAYGVYNWSTLDVNLLNCAKYGKKIIFEIATGNKSPDFIYNAPYNVPKLTFQEFKNASNPVPPLKTFEVPLFTDAAYKTLFEEFLVAFNEHLQAIQYAAPLDVYNLFWRLSVSGVNETTAEFRINSQVELTADGVTSTNATNIWTSAGVGCQEVLDSFKYFYGVITNIFPKQNTAVYFLTGGFPPLAGGLNIQTETVNWIKNEGIENCAFIYTSVNVGANGGSLFSYIKSVGLAYGGEMNSRVYEF